RLAEHDQGPMLRVDARSTLGAQVPAANVIAELRGREKPDEYVVLSAHLDSWDPASGATDNGTGTVVMMEAMRLLRLAYPNPRRAGVQPRRARVELHDVHLAHESRHVRQARVRRPAAQRDAGRDAGVSGVGGSTAHAARAACRADGSEHGASRGGHDVPAAGAE